MGVFDSVFDRVPMGIGHPNTLPIPIVYGFGEGPDLTTVTAVRLRAFTPQGLEVSSTFTGTVSIASGTTTGSMLAAYAWQGNELTAEGLWTLAPVLEVPGGEVPYQPGLSILAVRIP